MIDMWMDYILEMEALHASRLAEDHPIVCCLYPEQCNHCPPVSPPPLPPFDNSKRHRFNPKTKFMTCITCISKRIAEDTEHTTPNAEPPWRPSEEDLLDRVKIFTPDNQPGASAKEEWANAHIELITELEDQHEHLFIYSDRSVTEKNGKRTLGFGIVGYNQGEKVFAHKEALGEHT